MKFAPPMRIDNYQPRKRIPTDHAMANYGNRVADAMFAYAAALTELSQRNRRPSMFDRFTK